MNEQAFELTSLAMRYWFAVLMLIAVLCALRLSVIDRRRAKRARQAAPNMDYVGELLVVRGTQNVLRGERYPINRDVVIGRRRKCDVCLPDRSVFPRHARGELRSGGLLVGAIGRAPISLRGQPIQQEIMVHDGALMCIGEITLQLTLYDVPVEYDAYGETHAIDAARVEGDEFDKEYVPFENEFDEEYGRPADASEPDYLEEPAEEIHTKKTSRRSTNDIQDKVNSHGRRHSGEREFNPPDVSLDQQDDKSDELEDYDEDYLTRSANDRRDRRIRRS